jgi:hypothetical protein
MCQVNGSLLVTPPFLLIPDEVAHESGMASLANPI